MKIKRIISILLVAVIACIAFASCSNAETEGTTYISLRINPEIELITNDDGKVLYANAINDDGEVVLASVNLEGMTAEEASVAFTQKAIELGYLDPNDQNATVYVGVESEDPEDGEEVRQALNKNITDYFKNKGINGKVSQETLSKYAQRAREWELSTGHTKLVMRVLDEYPELTEEEVLDMEVNEWLDLLNENNGKNTVIAQLRTQYRNDVKAIREKYAGLFTLRAEIEELKGQLDDVTDTTEKDKIADRIKAKENEARTLRDEYKAELSALKLQFKKDVKVERKQSK